MNPQGNCESEHLTYYYIMNEIKLNELMNGSLDDMCVSDDTTIQTQ